MAIMMGKLYAALRAANVPDDEAIAAAEEVAGYETALQSVRSDLSGTEHRLVTEISAVEHRLRTEISDSSRRLEARIHQAQLQTIGVMAAMLGLLFALIKLV